MYTDFCEICQFCQVCQVEIFLLFLDTLDNINNDFDKRQKFTDRKQSVKPKVFLI